MKVGKVLLGASLSLSLAAFTLPCWASAPCSSRSEQAPAASTAPAGQQVAWGDDAQEHHEREERAERARARAEQREEREQMNQGEDEEHGGTRNFIREHIPGTEAHQQHEEREGEENHNMIHHGDNY